MSTVAGLNSLFGTGVGRGLTVYFSVVLALGFGGGVGVEPQLARKVAMSISIKVLVFIDWPLLVCAVMEY